MLALDIGVAAALDRFAGSLDDDSDLEAQIADKVLGDAFTRVPSGRLIRTVRPLPALLEHEVMVRSQRL